MLHLAYTVSSDLKDTLNRIDLLRQQVLVTPLAPKIELKLTWEAKFHRVYGSLALADNPLSKSLMLKLLTGETRAESPKNTTSPSYRSWLKYCPDEATSAAGFRYKMTAFHREEAWRLKIR